MYEICCEYFFAAASIFAVSGLSDTALNAYVCRGCLPHSSCFGELMTSRQTTSAPLSSMASVRVVPMKPAAPVTGLDWSVTFFLI